MTLQPLSAKGVGIGNRQSMSGATRLSGASQGVTIAWTSGNPAA